MKYKEKFLSIMREEIEKKTWTPHCVVVKKLGKLPKNVACLRDTDNRTCLMCAATFARDTLQEKFMEEELKKPLEQQVPDDFYIFDLYGFVYPVLMKIGRQLAGNVCKLTKEQAFQACDIFEKDPISF